MNIGYIIPQNPLKLKLRPWIIQEINELIKRGFTIILFNKNTQKSKIQNKIDYIIAHYLNNGAYVDRFNIPYGTIFHGSEYDKKIPLIHNISESKSCRWIGYDSLYNIERFGNITQKSTYTPVSARTDLFIRNGDIGDDIICGGRLIPQKGFHIVLKAHTNVLCFGGEQTSDMSYINQLKKIIPEKNLLGWKFDDDLKQIYEKGWLYIHSSIPKKNKIEGPSTTIKEAMLMELQIISTDIGGISELKYINFTEPNIESIRETISKTKKAKNLKGRDFIRKEYNIHKCVNHLINAIERYE